MPEIYSLSNKITVLAKQIPNQESVAINVTIATGSRHEDENVSGITHFLEHMAFKGTMTRSAKKIAEEFDQIGGQFNACTGREYTSFYAKALESDAKIAIDILADILINSTCDKTELENERQVILQEMAMCHDTPDDIIFDYYQETAFSKQSLGRPILGNRAFISNCSQDDLLHYMKTHYHGGNISIGLAGNVTENVKQMVEEAFSRLSFYNNQTRPEAGKYHGGFHYEERNLEQAHFLFGYDSISYNDPNFFTAEIASTALGGGMSSRLFQEVREKHGLAYNISSYHSAFSDAGIFTIYAGVAPNKVTQYLKLTTDLLKDATETLSQEELDRAKKQCITSVLLSQESNMNVADELARSHACLGYYMPHEELIEKYEAITLEMAKKFLQDRISGSKPAAAIIGKLDKQTQDVLKAFSC